MQEKKQKNRDVDFVCDIGDDYKLGRLRQTAMKLSICVIISVHDRYWNNRINPDMKKIFFSLYVKQKKRARKKDECVKTKKQEEQGKKRKWKRSYRKTR